MNDEEKLPVILLVDDNRDDYEATARSFRKANFMNPFHWCSSGQDALDYLHKKGKYADDDTACKPGLILLDLNMPGIDGRQLLEMIKHDSVIKRIPVIILTTSSDERDVNRCYDLGASTYIQKPVGFENLIEAVKRIKEYWFGVALLPKVCKYG